MKTFAAVGLAVLAFAGTARAQSRADLAPLPSHAATDVAPAVTARPPGATVAAAPAVAPSAPPSPSASPPPPGLAAASSEPIRVVLPNPLLVQLAPTIGVMPTTVAMSGPRVIAAEGDAAPDGYHEETRVRSKLLIAGLVTFGSLYVLSALTGAAMDDDDHGSGASLYAPCIGPFAQLAQTGSRDETGQVVLVIDGVAQIAGVAMTLAAIASPRKVFVRNDLAAHVTPRPFATRHGAGFGLTGTF